MTVRERAARVWASQGQAAAVLNDMTDEEAERLAGLEGSPNFRQEFIQFHADYFEARKAAADEPEVRYDKITLKANSRRSTINPELIPGWKEPTVIEEEQ